jgi:F0F1-type ATP synthase membrane subunit b/b'
MQTTQPQSRRFRFRLSTLLLVVVIAALLLGNVVQMIRLERQRMVAERARQDAEVARRQAEVSLQRAQVALDQFRAQVANLPANARAVANGGQQGARPK